ncbi:MAG: DEAD/DEAH box helicase [Solirubrobacterales bacterium]
MPPATSPHPSLEPFCAPVRRWFDASFSEPTPAQQQGWPRIAAGEHTLICAPTGSGKTLAAFMWGIDSLARRPADELGQGVRVVYVSPLKALSYDVERNLRAPLRGTGVDVAVGLRTGDTPQRDRQAMLRKPPDILITTPESLYLMLTSKAREILTGVEAVIIDEIHAVAQTKRGGHLALTLERLEHLVAAERDDPVPEPRKAAVQRIGLSATQRPLEEVGRFLTGRDRPCALVDVGIRKELDIKIHVPVEDMADPGADVLGPTDGLLEAPTATTQSVLESTVSGNGREADDRHALDTEQPLPLRSIWPAIYPELLRLVQAHTSTIVFVNSRRGAERLAVRLNEAANENLPEDSEPVEVARAHHGSLAHEERLVVEELLKSGQIPCLIATSSLELGIDMGAVDLVVQVESPRSVTRGLQRIGRAGHSLGQTSKGRVFPKYRADLLECAVVARRMREGLIEETVVPRNPLDVLAQHIVAMAAGQEWALDELEQVVRSAYPFAELGREQLENVLDMLDGRYPSDRFAELRPRAVWDRTAGTVRDRPGARQLAVTNAGTIPDRGLYGVHLPDGRRVGELDEEMVYEARQGQTFLLGASTWRIEEITRDRVIVVPAPGAPGAVPFWRGDSVGRPVELGRAIGAFAREAVSMTEQQLQDGWDLDRRAAQNLRTYLREQQQATRVVPSDETIVIERFRDEIGDWRLCILSPFGGRVHTAWGLAIAARLRTELDLEVDGIWSDDGIVIHLPDADEPPSADLVMLEADEVEELVVGELAGSALYGARFRENASRALLLPRAYPGKRTPLWQQRLKAQNLLEVARDYPRFPIVLETYRECLKDVLDLPALQELLRDLRARRVSVVEVETSTASPFASSLLFDFVATYMYEGDTPSAERRAAALALDRDLLRELLGQEELRELLDPEAIAEVEEGLQHLNTDRKARDRDALHQILRRLGDLTDAECAARVADGYSAESMLGKLERERRAAPVRIAGEQRWIASEDAGLYRDALGVPPPPGLPDSYLQPLDDALTTVISRYARTHAPFPTGQLATRLGVDPMPVLREAEREGTLVRGELLPGGTEREWCESEVLRRIRRASLARLRKEVEPADQRELARFLASWQNVDAHRASGAGIDRLRDALVPLQGVALTPEVWERDVLPRRLGAWSPAWLDALCTSGELVWIGAGPLGRVGRVALYFREDVHLAGPPPANVKLESPGSELHAAIRELLDGGPRFWLDLVAEIDAPATELHTALWDLAWGSEVTNDAFAPLRNPKLPASAQRQRSQSRRFARRRAGAGEAVQGRWSLTAPLFANAPGSGAKLRALAELMLERYGILTRETVLAEGIPGGFGTLYAELQTLELLGTARRGYFVEGLGGAQFALAGAVERLRSARDPEGELRVLAATDPANPYGGALPWPKRENGRRPARVPGAYVVLRDGELILYVERGGKGLLRLTDLDADDLEETIRFLVEEGSKRRIPNLAVERLDGESVLGTAEESTLLAAGLQRRPKRLVAPG